MTDITGACEGREFFRHNDLQGKTTSNTQEHRSEGKDGYFGNLLLQPRYSPMKAEPNDVRMSDAIPDEELMLRVRNDEVEALSTLFERHHVALFNFFYRLSGDASGSEDLVQDVFYRVLKYRSSYQPGSSFRTWMYQVARNTLNDQYRKRRGEVELEAAPVATVLPLDPVDDEQQMARLNYALMQLPEEKRELLLLTRFQGLKYEEVARLLQCEVGALKVRVHRALQELKEHFHRQVSRSRPHENQEG